MPHQGRLTIPSDKQIKDNVVAWLKYFVDVSSKKKVADQMGMSLAHITNVYNHYNHHPDKYGPGIRFLLRMHFGLDISMRELVYDSPPVAKAPRPAPPAPTPSERTNVGRARNQA